MVPAVIRRFEPDDLEGLLDVWFESAEFHAQIDPERYYVPAREVIRERYRTGAQYPENLGATVTLVAELQPVRGIAGFVDAWLAEPFDPMHKPMTYCFIADIAVTARHRGIGVGRQLIGAAEQWASERGARFVVLDVNAANQAAEGFYRKLGYASATNTMLRWL